MNKTENFIALLRGINVSGQKPLKMEALRSSLKNAGFVNIETYLQSGNVVFYTEETDIPALEQTISRIIENDFGYDVPVLVLSVATLTKVVHNNPFAKNPEMNPLYFHVTFLSEKPAVDTSLTSIQKAVQQGEQIVFSEAVVYLYCPNGYGQTKLTNTFLEKKLNTIATTRNWKTLNALVKMAE